MPTICLGLWPGSGMSRSQLYEWRLVRAQGSLAPLAAAGIVIAGSVTFLRILVLVAVFEPSLLAPLAMPMGFMAGVGLAGAGLVRLLAGSGE
ncbi:MAG TPA: DUF4010 domain-containing protein, partial [Thermohalobaculum sp.]|nr:DUF4010 domain-containing protein [Thermohalobaculum sp.]